MRFQKFMAATAAAVLGLSLAACGDDEDTGVDTSDVEEAEDLTGFAAELSESGEIKIGVKMDQPGIGYREPGADDPSGIDIEMGRIVAARLGLTDDDIEWVETVSDNREPFLQNGTVDIVIASYSITDERRQIVGQAGPYYVTGQSLLVAKDDNSIKGPDDLDGKKVCSVTGSTSIATVEEKYGAEPAGFDTYSECVDQLKNGSVDAVTTDGAILLGYAAEDPDALKVVGEPFSEERYGIGYNKDAEGMCEFLNGAIENAFDNGDWQKAFDATLGEGGSEAGDPPELDPCE
jgi:glutamate transport system substrate-binding protein